MITWSSKKSGHAATLSVFVFLTACVNPGGSLKLNTQVDGALPQPGVGTLGCGAIANGASTSRTMYQASSVATGQTCVSETQTATCNNGALSAYSGTFTNGNCYVESPPQPPVAGSSCVSGSASSITQFGITWFFSSSRPCGNYANGDYYVVGPVTITRITPESTTDANGWTINGTMVNPAPYSDQGYDSSIPRFANYSDSLNLAPSHTRKSLVAPANSSVLSSVSKSTPCTNTSVAQLTVIAILTVVPSAPAAGSFRPSPVGMDKTSKWNKNSLRYSLFQKLAPVASTPALATVESYFEKPWMATFETNGVQVTSPSENMPNYGRDQAQRLSLGLLSLHLNYSDAQKETLYIRLVQYGIDIYGSVKAGIVFQANGGQNAGRKAPVVLAALALNDPNMLEWADASKHKVFHEDLATFYVTPSDVGRTLYTADGRPRETYAQAHVGLPEWGEQHTTTPSRDASNWASAFYRQVGGAWHGNLLAIKLIPGGEAAWNYSTVFAYADRYWGLEGQNGQTNQSWSAPNNISPFVYDMWQKYR